MQKPACYFSRVCGCRIDDMPDQFTDAELLAYLDEALPAERMAALEQALRQSEPLRNRTAALRQQRDEEGHSVGEIWRRGRLSCPTRHQLGSFLLGALAGELADYITFHLETVGCRYCNANLDDLRAASQSTETEATQRRQKYFQSSVHSFRAQPGDTQHLNKSTPCE